MRFITTMERGSVEGVRAVRRLIDLSTIETPFGARSAVVAFAKFALEGLGVGEAEREAAVREGPTPAKRLARRTSCGKSPRARSIAT